MTDPFKTQWSLEVPPDSDLKTLQWAHELYLLCLIQGTLRENRDYLLSYDQLTEVVFVTGIYSL